MEEQVKKYFELLYPNFQVKADPEFVVDSEYRRAVEDEQFIRDNLSKIEELYNALCSEGKTPEEAIREAVADVKVKKYFEILYPASDSLIGKENQVINDKYFIRENIDAIDKMFQEIVHQRQAQGEEINEQDILKQIISELRIKAQTQSTGEAINGHNDEDNGRETTQINIVDETKFAEIHDKSKGIIKRVFEKIKSFVERTFKDR